MEGSPRQGNGGGSERSSGSGRPNRGREAEQVILHLTSRGWAGVRFVDGKGEVLPRQRGRVCKGPEGGKSLEHCRN